MQSIDLVVIHIRVKYGNQIIDFSFILLHENEISTTLYTRTMDTQYLC